MKEIKIEVNELFIYTILIISVMLFAIFFLPSLEFKIIVVIFLIYFLIEKYRSIDRGNVIVFS